MHYGEKYWFFFCFVSFIIFQHCKSSDLNHWYGMHSELLYLGKETMIKINKIISSVIRGCLFTAYSDARLGSVSMQWELLHHLLGTYSVELLLRGLGMLKFRRVQCAVK